MTTIQNDPAETAKALERLNGNYIYFRTQELMEACNKKTSLKAQLATIAKGFLQELLHEEPTSTHSMFDLSSLCFATRLAHDDQLKRHIAGHISETDWKWLGIHYLFSEDSPYMQLYLHDVRLKREYEATKKRQRENSLKHQKADNKAHNLNRKVGKRGMTR